MRNVKTRLIAVFLPLLFLSNYAFAETWPVSSSWGSGKYTRSGDFNGDGLQDIASPKAGNVYMKLSTGSGFTNATWSVVNQWGDEAWLVTGDFNGDGRDDIASPEGSAVRMKLSTGNGFTSQNWSAINQWGNRWRTYAGDFNGDGIDDIASAEGHYVHMKLSTGSGFTSQSWPVTSDWGGYESSFSGDFNGDGLADIASAQAGTIYMKLSTGSGFTSQTWQSPTISQWPTRSYSWAGDLNGDGMDDIAARDVNINTIIKVQYSHGSSFGECPPIVGPCLPQDWSVNNQWGSNQFTLAGDFNGDDRMDVASFSGGNGYMKFFSGSPTGPAPFFNYIYQSYYSATEALISWSAQNASYCEIEYHYLPDYFGAQYQSLPASGNFVIDSYGYFTLTTWEMTCHGSGGSVHEDGIYPF